MWLFRSVVTVFLVAYSKIIKWWSCDYNITSLKLCSNQKVELYENRCRGGSWMGRCCYHLKPIEKQKSGKSKQSKVLKVELRAGGTSMDMRARLECKWKYPGYENHNQNHKKFPWGSFEFMVSGVLWGHRILKITTNMSVASL